MWQASTNESQIFEHSMVRTSNNAGYRSGFSWQWQDLANVNDFFGKHGVPVLPVKAWFDFVLEPAARKRAAGHKAHPAW